MINSKNQNGEILHTPYPFDIHQPMTLKDAFSYCENIARTHYENFTVGSFLMPQEMRPSIYTVYAFCRWSDDLGDEIGNTQKSLELLEAWDQELKECKNGTPRHPILIALKEIIAKHDLPLQPFHDLITAFKMDQKISRYETFEELLHYCRHSANPVGRIFLMLFGYRDEERFALSDATCTALQLANFWQDVARDLEKGRIYIPLEDMRKFGYEEADLMTHRMTPAFVNVMQFEIARAQELFLKGLPLVKKVRGRVQLDIELFSQGGLEILNMIEKNRYDVFSKRPALSKLGKTRIAVWITLKFLGRNLLSRN